MNQIMGRHTDHSVAEIARDADRDRHFTAHEAVEYGLIDKVLDPNK